MKMVERSAFLLAAFSSFSVMRHGSFHNRVVILFFFFFGNFCNFGSILGKSAALFELHLQVWSVA